MLTELRRVEKHFGRVEKHFEGRDCPNGSQRNVHGQQQSEANTVLKLVESPKLAQAPSSFRERNDTHKQKLQGGREAKDEA